MTVKTIGNYDFPVKDSQDKFPAPLLYIGWDRHKMFCAPFCLPLPPDTPFGALSTAVFPGIFGAHPDFAKIDWNKVEWLKSGAPWQPDPGKSLAENGLKHKDVIRFRTPEMNGIQGSCS